MLDGVKAAGVEDNTIVTFVGDHGWALGEHGEWAKYQVYEVATRVPTLVHVPGKDWRMRGQATQARQTTRPNRVSVCVARTLNPIGQAPVTLSPRYEQF